jgi:hypothetical protein
VVKTRFLSLALLVVLTPLDDVVALTTPTTDDDALAAQNNDFLPTAVGAVQAVQRAAASLPPGYPPRPPAFCSWDRRAAGGPAKTSGPDLRYVLMSLLQ